MSKKDKIKTIEVDDVNLVPELLDGNHRVIPIVTGGDEPVEEVEIIPILTLRSSVLFPGAITPITVGRDKSINLVRAVNAEGGILGAVLQRESDVEDPAPDDMYKVGTAARIIKILEMPNGNLTVILNGLEKVEITEYITTEPYFKARVTALRDSTPDVKSIEFEALVDSIRDVALNIINVSPSMPKEAAFAIKNIDSKRGIINFICSNIDLPDADRQRLLEAPGLLARARRLLEKSPEQASVANLMLAERCRPCFDYHVGRGPGVCAGMIDTVEYARHVRQVENFLRGNRSQVVGELTEQMREAAADLDFERAGRLKARLDGLDALDDRQQVVFSSGVNADLIGFYREETISCACVFAVREGRTVRSVEFVLDKGLDTGEEELVSGFLKRYYDETADVPAEVDLPAELEDAELIEGWLAEKRGHSVRLRRPQRGEKRRLLDMASANARHALMRYMVRTGYADDRTNQALLQLESALALDAPPMRIECFDISTLHGHFTVASMVVFTNGRPDKSQYRRFKIQTPLTEANDFVSMSEVLGRRYSPERMADERFGSRPDLLVVDGGKPQLTAAMEQLRAGEAELQRQRELRSGMVSIACSETALHAVLLQVLSRFHRENPAIRLRVSNQSAPEAIDALRSGLAELAVVTMPPAPLSAPVPPRR